MTTPFLKRTFAWLMGVILLGSTAGVSIHQLYCYCLDQTRVSLFALEDACQEPATASESAPCCKKDLPACCAKSLADEQACSGDESEHDCTRKTTRVFQLKVKFLPEAPLSPEDYPLPAAECAPVFPNLCLSRPEVPRQTALCNKPPPLPLSGRDIGIRLQTFRC